MQGIRDHHVRDCCANSKHLQLDHDVVHKQKQKQLQFHFFAPTETSNSQGHLFFLCYAFRLLSYFQSSSHQQES